jgi:very-short-patch-repair endonuclease
MKIDFTSPLKHRSLEKPKRRVEKMLSFLEGFEYKLSPEGAVVFYEGNRFLIPYGTLYEKSTSTRRAVKDITYNLKKKRFYKEIKNEDFVEISFKELVFLFLEKMKFLPELLKVIELVEGVEKFNSYLGVEAILDFGKLRFIFRRDSKILADLSYETLRDRYLENEERVESLKQILSAKVQKIIEKEKKKETLAKKREEVRNRVYSYLEENGLKLVDPNFRSIEQKVSIICSCGRTFDYHLNVPLQYKVPSCPECRKTKSSLESFFEKEIASYIPVSFEFRKKIDGMEIDFIFENSGVGVELNGSYWHSDRKKNPYHLQKKKLFFLDRGINVLFFYDFWIFGKADLVASMIKAKLGMFDEVFYARRGIVREIDYNVASEFFEENHISGGKVPFSHSFGFFVGDELVSVAAFSKPRYRKDYEYELIRFANKKHTTTIGFLGKVLSIFKPKSLISYADLMFSDGKVYEKLGFKRISITQPGYFYTKDGRMVFSREFFQKHKIREYFSTGKFGITSFDESLTEEKNMEINGYYKIYTCGNLVYAYNQHR